MLIERSDKNPILKPNKNNSWEARAVFNGCPIKKGETTHLLYRALSLPRYHSLTQTKLMVSNIGIAESTDGVHFSNRKRFIVPEHSWERFGCEDPRVTKIDDKYYIFYTALSNWPPNAEGIKVGMAISHDLETIKEKHLITPFNAKAMSLFPERIGGKMWAMLTVNTDRSSAEICLASFSKEDDLWSGAYWEKWYKDFSTTGKEKYSLPLQRTPHDFIEAGAPPIKTKEGWLMFYSYIKNYFSPERLFTIEAVLLDLKNPLKIISRTKFPLLTPETHYETFGLIPNVVFPSGAILDKNSVHLYYGAADTTCCVAQVDLPALLEKMLKKEKPVMLTRAKKNPIITPIKENSWESKATFNPAAIYLNNPSTRLPSALLGTSEAGKVHILYRAMSEDNTSVLGYAVSKNGTKIDYRSFKPAYVPRESFEEKLQPGGNSGCEDPRLTKIGNKIYMFYTAFDGKNPPRVALTWIKEEDFLAQKWNWTKPILISPPGIDDKDACIFPEKFNGKYLIIHRIGDDIDFAFSSTLDFTDKTWLDEHRWIAPRAGMWDNKKVGIASPPIKTKKGWILFYHGVSKKDSIYRVGALLLDLNDPTKIIARTDEPLLEPETKYEKEGQIPNVVFPCGAVIIKNKIFVYYGGGDSVTGVATINVNKLLRFLESCKC